jgi:hypothetical protein
MGKAKTQVKFWIEIAAFSISIFLIIILIWMWLLGERRLEGFVDRLPNSPRELLYKGCGKMLMNLCPRFNFGILEPHIFCFINPNWPQCKN